MPSTRITSAPSAAEMSTSTETAVVTGPNVRKLTGTDVEFCTAKIAITIENASARKTVSCDTALCDGFGGWASRPACRGAVARELLRLTLVWRTWIVNTAQDAAVHQVSRGLFNFAIALFATSHRVSFLGAHLSACKSESKVTRVSLT